jgi:hypothetical protein
MAPPAAATVRDLRLDLFRGLALWFIFLDHIPRNVVNWLTIRNYGFSDAAEVFVFISGYTAAFVYGRIMVQRGFFVAGARIWKRAWTVYVAQIFLFAVFMAQISYVSRTFDNPLYLEEMNIFEFLREPDVTLIQAFLLKYTPVFMDVLPLYIVLLLAFPVILWMLINHPLVALATSLVVYEVSLRLGLNFPSYPSGSWFFNPLAWQLIFVFGAWCGVAGPARFGLSVRSNLLFWSAVGYLVFAFLIVMTWYVPALQAYVPRLLSELMYPIDKTNLDILRFTHFVALAVVIVRLVPVDSAWLKSPLAWPAIVCGQHSLEIFCLGVFLSFAGHFAIVEISGSILAQVLISLTGIAVMIAAASVFSWYKKSIEGRGTGPRPAQKPAAAASAEAEA